MGISCSCVPVFSVHLYHIWANKVSTSWSVCSFIFSTRQKCPTYLSIWASSFLPAPWLSWDSTWFQALYWPTSIYIGIKLPLWLCNGLYNSQNFHNTGRLIWSDRRIKLQTHLRSRIKPWCTRPTRDRASTTAGFREKRRNCGLLLLRDRQV